MGRESTMVDQHMLASPSGNPVRWFLLQSSTGTRTTPPLRLGGFSAFGGPVMV